MLDYLSLNELTLWWSLLGIASIVLVVSVTGLWVSIRRKSFRKNFVSSLEIKRDWQATGHINAICDLSIDQDDTSTPFLLRVEDDRIVNDIGGGDVRETRWRDPTRGEVRRIVASYHKINRDPKGTPIRFDDGREVGVHILPNKTAP